MPKKDLKNTKKKEKDALSQANSLTEQNTILIDDPKAIKNALERKKSNQNNDSKKKATKGNTKDSISEKISSVDYDEKIVELCENYGLGEKDKNLLLQFSKDKKLDLLNLKKDYNKIEDRYPKMISKNLDDLNEIIKNKYPKSSSDVKASLKYLNELKVVLKTETEKFVTLFIEMKGLKALENYFRIFDSVEVLSELEKKYFDFPALVNKPKKSWGWAVKSIRRKNTLSEDPYKPENCIEVEQIRVTIVECVRSVMNTTIGIKSLFNDQSILVMVSHCLISKDFNLRSSVYQIFSICCRFSRGRDIILNILEEFRTYSFLPHRFSVVVNELTPSINQNSDKDSLYVHCLAFINALISFSDNRNLSDQENLFTRMFIRSEFIANGILDKLNILKELAQPLLLRHIIFFETNIEKDENILSRFINEGGKNWEGFDVLNKLANKLLCNSPMHHAFYHLSILSRKDTHEQAHTHDLKSCLDADDSSHDCITSRILNLIRTHVFKKEALINEAKTVVAKLKSLEDQKEPKMLKENEDNYRNYAKDLLFDDHEIPKIEFFGTKQFPPVNSSPQHIPVNQNTKSGTLETNENYAENQKTVSSAKAPSIPDKNCALIKRQSTIDEIPIGFLIPNVSIPDETISDTVIPDAPKLNAPSFDVLLPPIIGENGIAPPPPMLNGPNINVTKSKDKIRLLPNPKINIKHVNISKIPESKIKGTFWESIDVVDIFSTLQINKCEPLFKITQRTMEPLTATRSNTKKSLLDISKAQNVLILLGKVKLTTAQICEAFLKMMPNKFLDYNVLNQIAKFIPPVSDADLYLQTSAEEIETMHDADKFIWELLRVPDIRLRIKYLSVNLNFDSSLNDVKELAKTVEESLDAILNNKYLPKILETVLCLSNYLLNVNQGSVYGIKLASINSFCSTKSTTNQYKSIMSFIAELLLKQDPEIAKFGNITNTLKKGAKIKFEDISLGLNQLENTLKGLKTESKNCEGDVKEKIDAFTNIKTKELDDFQNDFKEVETKYGNTLEKFGEDCTTMSSEEMLEIILQFAVSFESECDNIKIQEKKEEMLSKSKTISKGRYIDRLAPNRLNTMENKSRFEKKTIDQLLMEITELNV